MHLNQWTQQLTRWLPIDRWKACKIPRTADARGDAASGIEGPFDLTGRPCVLAIDLSLSHDLSALVELYPYAVEPGDRESGEAAINWGVYCVPNFWVPEEGLEAKERADHASYRLWAKQGYLHLIPGPAIDDAWIEERVRELTRTRKVAAVCFDPYAASGVAGRLEKERKPPVVFVKQSVASIAPEAKVFYLLVLSGRFQHGDPPVMNYCAGNVAVKTDHQGNVYPVKSKSRGRIDGITAAITGLSHVMLDPLPKPKKVGEVCTLL